MVFMKMNSQDILINFIFISMNLCDIPNNVNSHYIYVKIYGTLWIPMIHEFSH